MWVSFDCSFSKCLPKASYIHFAFVIILIYFLAVLFRFQELNQLFFPLIAFSDVKHLLANSWKYLRNFHFLCLIHTLKHHQSLQLFYYHYFLGYHYLTLYVCYIHIFFNFVFFFTIFSIFLSHLDLFSSPSLTFYIILHVFIIHIFASAFLLLIYLFFVVPNFIKLYIMFPIFTFSLYKRRIIIFITAASFLIPIFRFFTYVDVSV